MHAIPSHARPAASPARASQMLAWPAAAAVIAALSAGMWVGVVWVGRLVLGL